MLRRLRLSNFKSARDLSVRLAPLTVLAGLNGSGKSTVLQALALVAQSYGGSTSSQGLQLRGRVLNLGRSEDVHFEHAKSAELRFEITTDVGCAVISATAADGQDTLASSLSGEVAAVLDQFARGFQYVQADRLTPASLYARASTPDQTAEWLGSRGEFTVDFLRRNGHNRVPSKRLVPTDWQDVDADLVKLIAPTPTLDDQTAAWLQLLSPGVRLLTKNVDLADAVALRFQYTSTGVDSTSKEHRPANVGFGLTYSLPIVVACLAAAPGSVLLLENPEAHLHPRGQAALGQLLAVCAADGVQILVETHSDHLLNGIRVAVRRRLVDASSVALHYFSRDLNTGESAAISPNVLPDGQLDSWPVGFFDQWDRSLDALLD